MPFHLGLYRHHEAVNEDLGESFIVPCSPRIGPIWEPDYVCDCGWEGDEPEEKDELRCPECGASIEKGEMTDGSKRS